MVWLRLRTKIVKGIEEPGFLQKPTRDCYTDLTINLTRC